MAVAHIMAFLGMKMSTISFVLLWALVLGVLAWLQAQQVFSKAGNSWRLRFDTHASSAMASARRMLSNAKSVRWHRRPKHVGEDIDDRSPRPRVPSVAVDILQAELEPTVADVSQEALKINAAHMRVAAKFEFRNMERLVRAAEGYPLAAMFDKSHKIAGDETYENLIKLHVDTLAENDITAVEDKIVVKNTAIRLGVTPTTYCYAAHRSDYDAAEMREALSKFIASGKTSYIVKPTHMAWSKGLLVVCDQDKDLDFVEAHIRDNILNSYNDGADCAHLLTLEPGVIIEDFFGKKPGEEARIPLECKVQLVWGEVHDAWFVGQDQDGRTMHNEAAKIFGDGTSWGITDARSWIKDEGHWDKIVEYSRKMARGLGADFIRADFFLAPGLEDVQLNEVEAVNGNPHFKDRKGLGEVWRLGYTAHGNFALDEQKVNMMQNRMARDRDFALNCQSAGTL